MTTELDERTQDPEDITTPEAVIAAFRREILAGEPWYPALLRAIGRWRLPREQVDGRRYHYLIGGEAFDWLLLAERLTDAAADLIPEHEREQLLFFNRPPLELDLDEFRRLIGPAKYRAHLNFLYGVVVEEALQLAVELDVQKELRARVWGSDRRTDETAFERIYGRTREALLAEFRGERGLPQTPSISLTEQREFTYWLFKRRLRTADPARVASDTRRGLAQLSRLEACRRPRPMADEPAAEQVIEVTPHG